MTNIANFQDYMTQLLNMLALYINPTTLALGALLSQFLEQTGWFKREDVPSWLKFVAVLVLSLLFALILAVFTLETLPVTLKGWGPIFLTGLAIALGSQVLHVLVKQYAPGLGDWLTQLLTLLKVPPDTLSKLTVTDSTGTTMQKTVGMTTNVSVPSKPADPDAVRSIVLNELENMFPPISNDPPFPIVEGENG